MKGCLCNRWLTYDVSVWVCSMTGVCILQMDTKDPLRNPFFFQNAASWHALSRVYTDFKTYKRIRSEDYPKSVIFSSLCNFQSVSRLTWFQTYLRKAMIDYFLLRVLPLSRAPAYIFLIQTVGSASSWLRLSQRRPFLWRSGLHLHVTTRENADTAASRPSLFMYSPAYLLCIRRRKSDLYYIRTEKFLHLKIITFFSI